MQLLQAVKELLREVFMFKKRKEEKLRFGILKSIDKTVMSEEFLVEIKVKKRSLM